MLENFENKDRKFFFGLDLLGKKSKDEKFQKRDLEFFL